MWAGSSKWWAEELLYRIQPYLTPYHLGPIIVYVHIRSSICHHFPISCNSLSKDLTQYKKKHVSGVLSIMSDEHGRFMTFPILLHHLQPVHPMSIVHPLTAALEQCASSQHFWALWHAFWYCGSFLTWFDSVSWKAVFNYNRHEVKMWCCVSDLNGLDLRLDVSMLFCKLWIHYNSLRFCLAIDFCLWKFTLSPQDVKNWCATYFAPPQTRQISIKSASLRAMREG